MAISVKRLLVYYAIFCLMNLLKISAQDESESEQAENQPTPSDAGAQEGQLNEGNGASVEKNCKLESFKLQEDFDLSRFQGYWYVLSINRYWTLLPKSVSFKQKNIQANYRLLSDGKVELKTAASFISSLCDYVTGIGVIRDKLQPQKLEVEYKTWIDRSAKKNPYWVVKTDYEYAVVYSCLKARDDGTCDPDSAYMWTLNRKRGGHNGEQLEEIAKAAEYMCISPGEFKVIEQDGGCKFDPEKFPTGGIGIILFVIFCVVIIIFIFVTCFCCISKVDKQAQKKKTQ